MIKTLFTLSLVSVFTKGLFTVPADLETEASPYPGDSVDDIAIWRHPRDPARSLIIATLKASNQMPRQPTGLLIYDLDGVQRQFLAGGTPNNVDLRDGFHWQAKTMTIVAASHWWSNDVSLYTVDPETLQARELTTKPIPTGLEQLRGLCMYKDNANDDFYYIVVNKAGDAEQYLIETAPRLSARRVRTLSLGSIAEGCVADDRFGRLYIAEERVGIWRYQARPGNDSREQVDRVSWTGTLRADIEGLTVSDDGKDGGYLIASSQGNSIFVVYDRVTNDYVGSFRIVDANGVDKVSHTDGIDVHGYNLGPGFPNGIFVAHDNRNETADGPGNQNFKLVDWQRIEDHLERLRNEGAR